ncbi:MAG: hypothetical protein PHI05_03540 [Bacilli bacterium]|nr:hypothetical protein [Bacilli bacterium]MDD4547794.1 hypothetical protein [Bacilli bacterium]
MKKIKILLILLIMIIITGCDVDYKAIVDSNYRVKETVKFIGDNKTIAEKGYNVDLYLTEQIETHENISLFKGYNFIKKIGKTDSFVTIDRQHRNLEDYSRSPVFNQLFESAAVVYDEDTVTFNTTGENYYKNFYNNDDLVDPDFYVDKITIQMRFHNNIIESNADSTDEATNTLTWNVSSSKELKKIYFKIGNDKRYDIILMDYVIENKIKFISILLTLLVVGGVTLKFYENYKKNDSI